MSAGPWQGANAMVSTEHDPIIGVCSGGPAAEPPVGVKGARPSKLDAFCILCVQRKL